MQARFSYAIAFVANVGKLYAARGANGLDVSSHQV